MLKIYNPFRRIRELEVDLEIARDDVEIYRSAYQSRHEALLTERAAHKVTQAERDGAQRTIKDLDVRNGRQYEMLVQHAPAFDAFMIEREDLKAEIVDLECEGFSKDHKIMMLQETLARAERALLAAGVELTLEDDAAYVRIALPQEAVEALSEPKTYPVPEPDAPDEDQEALNDYYCNCEECDQPEVYDPVPTPLSTEQTIISLLKEIALNTAPFPQELPGMVDFRPAQYVPVPGSAADVPPLF